MNDRVADKGRFRRARKLVGLVRVPFYRRALRLGVAATIEHAAVPLGDGYRTVIDVGAHHGQFALFAAKTYPEAQIHCIEPHAASRRRLERLAELLPQLTVIPFAAAETAREARLHVSRKTDSSSLLSILTSYTDAFPGTEEVSTETIEARTLDDLLEAAEIQPPVLLKIDVQGSELSVLRGATTTLEVVDCVLVECSFVELYQGQALAGDIVAHLNDRFVVAGAFGVVRDGRGEALQADLLFRRRSLDR